MSEQPKRRAWKVREAAAQLGLPYESTLDAIHNGQLGAIKVGRYYLVPDEEIARMLAPAQKSA